MATVPVATIDPSLFAGVDAFPLTIVSDGNVASPDVVLDGAIGPYDVYGYALTFVPGMTYRVATSGAEDGFAERALLIDRVTGEVLWGNLSGLQTLGLVPAAAATLAVQPITVATTRDVSLMVFNPPDAKVPAGAVGNPFHIELRADLTPDVPPPAEPLTPANVYRFFNQLTGKYFFTVTPSERDLLLGFSVFRFDGVVFTEAEVSHVGWIPVYRIADTENGSYLYTADAAERATVLAKTSAMRDEGIGFFAPQRGDASTLTADVYRLYSPESGAYLYTTNPIEKLYTLLKGGWVDQGVAFQSYVSTVQVATATQSAGAVTATARATEKSVVSASTDAAVPAYDTPIAPTDTAAIVGVVPPHDASPTDLAH